MTETPKPRKRRAKKIEELPPESQQYLGAQEPYRPPENMISLNDERYLDKPKVGKEKAVRGPGTQVVRVGLGNLKVIHSNPIDYYGNIDVRSDTSGPA